MSEPVRDDVSSHPDGMAAPEAAGIPDPPSSSSVTPRARRWFLAPRGLVLVAAVTAVASIVTVTHPPQAARVGTVRQAPDQAGSTTPLTTGSGLPDEVTDPEARQAAVARLLLDRGEAVRRDDADAWQRQQLATATTPDFADLAALPVSSWTYTVESTTSAQDPTAIDLVVSVAYRLDVDIRDALLRERMSLQHTESGWRVALERTEGSRGQPWDLGALTVERGRRSVVIGIDSPPATLRRYAALADAVADDVTSAWGPDWTRRPVLVVARTTNQVARALGRSTSSLTRIAAVTTAEDGDGVGRSAEDRGADRVWTNTPVMASLSSLGREIVLRHEMLHAATGAAATNATPLWLEEGLAEYVGYAGTGVALRVATSDVLDAVRAGRGPTALPTPAEFAGPRLAEAYESAHVACDLLVDEIGIAGLVRVYRLTAQGDRGAADNVDAALRAVTGGGLATLESRWRSRLRDLAG